jgi:hypothetical protein
LNVKKHFNKPVTFHNVKRKNNNYLFKDKQVFILSRYPYQESNEGYRAKGIAEGFYELGYSVFYYFDVYSNDNRVSKEQMPLYCHEKYSNQVVKRINDLITKDDIVIIMTPLAKFLPVIMIAKEQEAVIIYDHNHNWDSSVGDMFFQRRVFVKILRFASFVTISSNILNNTLTKYYDRFKITTPIIELENAFSINKLELATNEQYFLYCGSLSNDILNWELLISLADSYPNYEFLIIGKKIKQEYELPSNIKLLGCIESSKIIEYLKNAKYIIIPYLINDITKYDNPFILYEALAMKKRVIATNIPSITDYSNVYCGKDLDSWKRIIDSDYKFDEVTWQSFYKNHNWLYRINSLKGEIIKDKISDLFYNNISIIIVSNDKKELIPCLDTLLDLRSKYHYEIVVVTKEELNPRYVRLVNVINSNKKNYYLKQKQGIKKATKKYIFTLSPKNIIFDDFLDTYLDIWQKIDKVGIIGSLDNKPIIDANVLAFETTELLSNDNALFLKNISLKHKNFSESVRLQGYKSYYCPFFGIKSLPISINKDKI